MDLNKTCVNVIIERAWLEDGMKLYAPDDDPMLTLKKLARESNKPNHNFLFHGYDEDPREVKDIPECQVFCKRVMRECPEFINVATEHTVAVLLYGTALRLFNGECQIHPAWEAVWTKEHIASMRLLPWRLQ